MVKGKQYHAARKLILAGAMETFSELVDIVPKTTLAKELRMHHITFGKHIENPATFSFEVAFRIAALIEVDPMAVVNLIAKQALTKMDDKGKHQAGDKLQK